MPAMVYVNGRYVYYPEAQVAIEDRGYQFADGVYEVMEYVGHTVIDEKEHLQRLEHSLAALSIPLPMSIASLRCVIQELIRLNRYENGAVYLQVTRGVAPRNHAFPAHCTPSLVMTIMQPKAPPVKDYEHGVAVITCPDIRWLRKDIKSIALLPNVLAKQKAVEARVAESLFVNADGYITEGSATNVFIIDRKGVLRTHPANEHILGGITRLKVVEVAKKEGIAVKEEAFTVAEAERAREMFITSSTRHILPVSKMGKKVIGDGKAGKVTTQLMGAYRAYCKKQYME